MIEIQMSREEAKAVYEALAVQWHRGVAGDLVAAIKQGLDGEAGEPVVDEQLVQAGINAALQVERIRELEKELTIALGVNERWEASFEMNAHVVEMTDDECAITQAFIVKLMGEGRKEHGKLTLLKDTRSVDDLLSEALDEALDSVSYVLMARRKMELAG